MPLPKLDSLRTNIKHAVTNATTAITATTGGLAGGMEPEAPKDHTAGNEGLLAAFARLHAGATAAVSGAPSGESKTLHQLRADLNVDLLDDSPFVVTKGEAQDAHAALLAASPAELSDAIAKVDDAMLDRYLTRLSADAPFRLDHAGPTPLAQFAHKIASDLDPAVGAGLVGRLDDDGKRRLLEGVLQLDGADVTKLRAVLGDEGFASLARGGKSKDESIVGGALVDGRVWSDNVTEDFKSKYAAALDGKLTLPDRAKDTVFLTGPGLFGDELPGYLEPNKRALVECGVPAENVSKLKYNTADDPTVNADAIYAQVKAQHDAGKHVVVMGHSKFGRDMLEAFHRHPDLKQMIDGAVMMQPALSAPIAKDLLRPELARVLDPVLALVGGNRAAFDGMATRGEDLPPWPSDVPTMLFASSTESKAAMLAAGAGPYYGHFYNAAADGAVAFQDQAALSGAHLVTLPGLADHAEPGLTFTDACEHFARQLDAGAADDVIKGIMGRLRGMAPNPALFDAVDKAFTGTASSRKETAALLRSVGPMLDRAARVQNKNAGYPLVDNIAMTKALVAQLFERA